MTYLVRVFLGSRLIRAKGRGKQVFLAAIRACLSSQVASDMEKLIAAQPLPGPSTMSHCEFVVDVTLMMHMRKYHAEAMSGDSLPAVFSKFDSSPQGGIDWMNSQWVLIEGEDVVEFYLSGVLAAQIAADICRLLADEEDSPGAVNMADLQSRVHDQMELLELMRECLHIHFCVPVGPIVGKIMLLCKFDPLLRFRRMRLSIR